MKTIAIALLLLAASCTEPFEPYSEQDVKFIVKGVTSEYGVTMPQITFDPNAIRFRDESLAETVCTPSRNTCEIIFMPCALENRNIEQLAVHEAAHVVVAHRYQMFDHGDEWQMVMKDQGYRPNALLHNKRC